MKRYISDTKKSAKGGKGGDDAAGTLEPCVTALLNVLCFSTPLLNTTWAIIQSNSKVVADLYSVIDVNKRYGARFAPIDLNQLTKELIVSLLLICPDGNL